MVAIGAVRGFGGDVASYYSVTASIMKNPDVLQGEGVTFYVAGPPPAPQMSGIPYGYASAGEFLYGTPYPDAMNVPSSYAGVFGGDSDDLIQGTSASQIHIGGLGADDISGGAGGDTYVIAPGDGIDWIDETNGDTSIDTLDMREIPLSRISATKTDENLELKSDTGDGVRLVGYFRPFEEDAHFESARFSDVTIGTPQDFRNMVADRQKGSGNVFGTKQREDFEHTISRDGSYVIHDDHSGSSIPRGVLTFTDGSVGDVRFKNEISTSQNDLVIQEQGGDSIRIKDQHSLAQDTGVLTIAFSSGGVAQLDLQGIRSKAADDMKLDGYVKSTRWTERLFHDALVDKSYTIDNDHAQGDPLETFEILGASPSDVRFEYTGAASASDFRMHFADGSIVTILKGFEDPSASNSYGIAGVKFANDPAIASDDVAMSIADITAKVVADNKPLGYIRGSQAGETIVYVPGDPSLTYYPGYGPDSYVDTIDMSAYVYSEVIITKKFNHLRVTLPTGQIIDIKKHYLNNSSVEQMIFSDGAGGTTVLNKDQINAAAG